MRLLEKITILQAVVLLTPWSSALAQPTSNETSTGGDRQPETGIVATVNDEPIYFEDVERLLGNLHGGVSPTNRQAPDLDKMLFRLVNDKLLAQEARALGMEAEEPIPTKVVELRDSLAVKLIEQKEIWGLAEPTDEELRQAFQDDYRTITLRVLTVYEQEDAESLLAELEQGADFATLTTENSIDQYSPRGGLIEDLPKIDLPHELAADAFAMKPGELKGPIRTRLGWSIIQVKSFADAGPERFDELRASLTDLVRYRNSERLRTALAARLRATHPVVIDEKSLGGVVANPLPDGRIVSEVEAPESIVARVGDRTITAEELGKELQTRWKGVRNEEAAVAAKPLVLKRLIRDELMLAEALARGYGDLPQVRRELRAYETQLLVQRFLDDVIAADLEVSREEMETYYEEYKNQYHRPPRIHLGQITVASEEEADRLAELLRQGSDLSWLARQHSIDSYKDDGGSRGWVIPTRSGDPIIDALLETPVGEVVGPVRQGGNHVVMIVSAREEQGIYSFQEVSGNIRKAVRDRKFQQALHNYLETLRSRSEITVNEDVLATLRIMGSPIEEDTHGGGMPHGQNQQ